MIDWQVGDLAVCVDDAPNPRSVYGVGNLKRGKRYRVTRVEMDIDKRLALSVDGARSEHPLGGYKATRFRKLNPPKHEACEPEFVTLLKRTKVTA